MNPLGLIAIPVLILWVFVFAALLETFAGIGIGREPRWWQRPLSAALYIPTLMLGLVGAVIIVMMGGAIVFGAAQ